MAAVGILAELDAELLVVAKRDRLARDTMAAAMIERLVEKAGARIMTANGVGNGDSPEALLMRRMIDAFAEYERMVIKARTKAALAVKKARGERVGEVPYGHRAEGSRLVPDEAEAELVTIVVSLRAAGMSYRKIAAELEARGLRNRKGKPLAANQVVRIVKRAA
jgi:DNA invertase Pin-like site-specific DNA recombinase